MRIESFHSSIPPQYRACAVDSCVPARWLDHAKHRIKTGLVITPLFWVSKGNSLLHTRHLKTVGGNLFLGLRGRRPTSVATWSAQNAASSPQERHKCGCDHKLKGQERSGQDWKKQEPIAEPHKVKSALDSSFFCLVFVGLVSVRLTFLGIPITCSLALSFWLAEAFLNFLDWSSTFSPFACFNACSKSCLSQSPSPHSTPCSSFQISWRERRYSAQISSSVSFVLVFSVI